MLLIDTYNVLHATGILPPDLAGLEPEDLADQIAASRYAGRPVKLVLDGLRPTPTGLRPGVEFLFAGPGREADELIELIIGANSAPRRLLVVSSDRRIVAAARRRRVPTLSSQAFLAQLATDRGRQAGPALPAFTQDIPLPAFTQDIPLDAYSVAQWLMEFGFDADNVDLLRRQLASRKGRPPPSAADGAPSSQPTPPREAGLPSPPASAPPVDPLLLAALQEWPGRLSLDDLDMRRWLNGPSQNRSPRPKPPRGRGRASGG